MYLSSFCDKIHARTDCFVIQHGEVIGITICSPKRVFVYKLVLHSFLPVSKNIHPYYLLSLNSNAKTIPKHIPTPPQSHSDTIPKLF